MYKRQVIDGLNNTLTVTGDNTPGASAILVLGNNVSVRGFNIISAHTGIRVQQASNILITLNFINNSNYSAIHSNVSVNPIVFQNLLAGSGFFGVYLEWSFGALVQQNFVFGREVPTLSGGIGILGGSGHTISDNLIRASLYPLGMWTATGNTVARNIFDRAVANGAFIIFGSSSNTFNHNVISNSLQSAVYIDSSSGTYFKNLTALNTSTSYYDIETTGASSSFELTDTSLRAYKLNNSAMQFYNTADSRINFTQNVTVTGANLSDDIKLAFNFVEVNSTGKPALNKSALVTFEGLVQNFVNATIFRNGVSCPPSICTALTGLNAGTVIINVTGWTNYSIGSGIPPGPIMDINEPDPNDAYTPIMFPVTFSVDLSQNGSVWFTLNNGSSNTTMNTTNNLDFDYLQSLLSLGNYTFRAYANFTNYSGIIFSSVNFRVINSTIGGSQNNTPQNNTPINNNTVFPPNTTVVLNGSSGNNSGNNLVEAKYIVYWLLIAVLSIAVVILVFLIIKAIQAREIKRNTIPGSIVSQLR